MAAQPTRTASARWLVVALPGVGALVMLAVLTLGWVQTRNAADLILRGEASLLLDRVGRAVRDLPAPPSGEALHAVVDSEARAGLLFLAAVGPDGSVIAQSGPAPDGIPEAEDLRAGDFRRDGRDRKSTRLNSSHLKLPLMPSPA